MAVSFLRFTLCPLFVILVSEMCGRKGGMRAMRLMFCVLLGYGLDALFGDPEWLWHPVCGIGRLIALLERPLRFLFPKTKWGERTAGCVLWLVVCAVSFGVPFGLLRLLNGRSRTLGFVLETVFCYQIFARRCLADEGRRVFEAVRRSVEEGRAAVARVVGRDTAALSKEGVIRAAVETIAENTTDGVIAPMVFLLLGGAPLGFLYKAVNTMDSMVGYHNDRFEHYGWCAAKMDDLFNFVPARFAAVCMTAAAGMLKFDARNARRIFQRDRFNHKSPNSAQTESVCAGALHIQLAGDASYFGKPVHKPTIGDADREIVSTDILRAEQLMTTASTMALVLLCVVRLLLTA